MEMDPIPVVSELDASFFLIQGHVLVGICEIKVPGRLSQLPLLSLT